MGLRRTLTRGLASAVPVAFLVLMLLGIAAYATVADSSLVKTALMFAIPLASALAVVLGVVYYRPVRGDLWYLIVVAQVAGAVGAGTWHTKFAANSAPTVPGGSQDFFFIGFYFVLGAALVVALRRSEPGNQGVIDAAIFAAGGMLLTLAINPYMALEDLDSVGRIAQIASAFAAVSLLAVALRLLMTETETASLQLLVGAAIAWSASDLVWVWLRLTSGYDQGSWAGTGWLAFYAFCGAAALHPSMRTLSAAREPHAPTVRWPYFSLLALALMGSTVLTGYGLLLRKEANSAGTVAITSVLSLLVLTRIALLLRGEQRLRRELDLRNERLLELDRLKDGFVAAISHELRTPLTSIRGFTMTMTERWHQLTDDDKLTFLHTIDTQAKRLNRLIDSVLLISRIQAGRLSGLREPVDVAERARDAVAELDLDVDIDVSGKTPGVVEADPDQIHQIFVNLLVNASRYGTPPITIGIVSDDLDVTARVSDQGDGVPSEFIPHLFDDFTQAPNARVGQGSGLGLAIVKGLVESAGGNVWYEELRPRGACFVLRWQRFSGSNDGAETVQHTLPAGGDGSKRSSREIVKPA